MRRTLFVTSLAACLVAALGTSSASASFPGQDPRTLYSRDGSLRTITQVGKLDAPVGVALQEAYPGGWAPTGPRIVVAGRRESMGRNDIFTARADGTKLRNVTKSPDDIEWSPRWSPDGRRIAFMRLMGDDTYDLFTIRPDGSGLRNLTESAGVNEVAPRWDPNGARILFASDAGGNFDLATMNRDGSDPLVIVDEMTDDFPGDYRPNGDRIVFWRDWGDGSAFLLEANADGSDVDYFFVDGGSAATSPITTPASDRVIFMYSSVDRDFRGLYRYRNGGSKVLIGGPNDGPTLWTDRWDLAP